MYGASQKYGSTQNTFLGIFFFQNKNCLLHQNMIFGGSTKFSNFVFILLRVLKWGLTEWVFTFKNVYMPTNISFLINDYKKK